MIKHRFPKRKNGTAADGISIILPHYHRQELETIQKKHTEELGNVSKKLEEVKEREVKEADRNVNLETKLMELDSKKNSFVQILIEQEKKVKDYESKCLTLNTTLAESETLNQDMTKKLQQYSDDKTRLIEENELLTSENTKLKNRNEMEQSKFELMKQKNDSLRKELNDTTRELTLTKRSLNQHEMDLKLLSDELKKKGETVTNANPPLHVSSLSDVTSQELLSQLHEEQQKCEKLENDLKTLRMSGRDSEMKLISSGQSLEQLQSLLHRKSAECSALQISKDTFKCRITNLDNENHGLRAKLNQHEVRGKNLDEEIRLREQVEKHYQDLMEEMTEVKSETSKYVRFEEESTNTIKDLKDQIKNLTQQTIEHQAIIASLQKIQDTLQRENETWKKNYTVAHNKLLSIKYEKSDAAKVDLQRENMLLKMEITKLKEEISTTGDYFREENVIFKRSCERTIEIERHEKRDLRQYANNLQATLDLANIKINQNSKLSTAKDLDYKNAVEEKLELKSKLFYMEQRLKEIERENLQKEDRLLFIENENRELQSNVDQLTNQSVFSLTQCICGKKPLTKHRMVSCETYFDAKQMFCLPKHVLQRITIPSCSINTKYAQDIT